MLEKSILFKRLKKLEKKEFALDSNPISSKIIEELLEQSRDILNRVSQYLPDYTLHDIHHSCRVLENIENILPPSIKLNILEIKILIYAIFLHDIGMTSDKIEEELFNNYSKEKEEKEKQKIFENYIKKINKRDVLDRNLENDFLKLLKIELDNYDNTMKFSEYIRINHVRRSKMKLYILKKNIDFEYKGVCLLNHIYDVILSHSLDFIALSDEKYYPLEENISNKKVNILFISILLRMGDLLDADISRTPKYVYDFFQFKDKKSQSKWEKNLSLIGKQITNYNVSFNYMSSSPEQERDIRRYIDLVEIQILNTNKVLKHSIYKLNLSPIIELTVRNNSSYKSADKLITIEYDKVKKILMGLELYDNETMFLRELIQNARDACKMRMFYCNKLDIKYKPKISISFDEDNKILIVKDNGIGMNDEIINKFFIKIGNSSYNSIDFYEQYKFHPIGKFGIGIFSTFMASNQIDVKSIRFRQDGFFDKPINITLKIDEKYVIDYETDNNIYEGTQISMKLNDSVKKLNNEVIKNKIKKMVSNFFDVPIYLNDTKKHLYKYSKVSKKCDKDEIYLDNDKYTLKLKFDTRSKKQIIFSDSEENIKVSFNGISIFNTQRLRRNFLLDFFNLHSGVIEINGNIPLALKASRDAIIIDDVSKKLYSEINNDIFNKIIKENKEKYFTKNIVFDSGYDELIEKSFFNKMEFTICHNNSTKKKNIIDILQKNRSIYVIDKIFQKNKLCTTNKNIVVIENKNLKPINGILKRYITNKETIINNNLIYDKLELNYKDKEHIDNKNDFITELFINFNKKKVLFIMDTTSPIRYKINKTHFIGRKIFENIDNIENIGLTYIMNLINNDVFKHKNKLLKKYNNKIPKQYIQNLNQKLYNKKSLKYTNKMLNSFLKEIGSDSYKVTKKDFLKGLMKKLFK